MGVSNRRHACLCYATSSHGLKLRLVRITEKFMLLGI
jgi:hypothetical protein